MSQYNRTGDNKTGFYFSPVISSTGYYYFLFLLLLHPVWCRSFSTFVFPVAHFYGDEFILFSDSAHTATKPIERLIYRIRLFKVLDSSAYHKGAVCCHCWFFGIFWKFFSFEIVGLLFVGHASGHFVRDKMTSHFVLTQQWLSPLLISDRLVCFLLGASSPIFRRFFS